MTRPFGATFGDLLTKFHEQGGLKFGTIGSSIVLASIFVILVYCTSGAAKATLQPPEAGPLPDPGFTDET